MAKNAATEKDTKKKDALAESEEDRENADDTGADTTKHVSETDVTSEAPIPEGPVEPSGSQPSDVQKKDGSVDVDQLPADRYIEGETHTDGTPVGTPERPRSTNEAGRVDEDFAAAHRPRG